MTQRRIMFIGAHPDDADLCCGATAIKLARAGHIVKFVSATNGDTGHHILSRAETAKRRYGEAQAAAKLAGVVEYEILNHDCGLEISVENRREILRVIRRFKPDLVITHRTCDYHPDHRAIAQLVQDTAYVVMVPHFCEDTSTPDYSPVYACAFDAFDDPRPHRADAVIEIDSVIDQKLALWDCHASQFYEWMPWVDGDKNFDINALNDQQKREHLMKWMQRFKKAANCARPLLKNLYGDQADHIVYAETFEQSPYARVLPLDEFQKLFEA